MTKIGINEVIERLRGMGLKVRPGRNGEYYAQCPAHDDRNPSLSLREADGKLLIHCHAGCEYGDIMQALGFSAPHGHAAPSGANGHRGYTGGSPIRWLAEYCDIEEAWLRGCGYVAERGNEVAFQFHVYGQVAAEKLRRAGSKDMRWEGRVSPGLWPMPDKLPAHIVITEGETDALILRRCGIEAYAVTKGASAGLDAAVATYLRKAGVVSVSVVFDTDEAGRAGAEKVRQALLAAGIRVDVVDLADYLHPLLGGKDIRDLWLIDKGGAGRLMERLRTPPSPSVARLTTAAELLAMDIPMPKWRVAGLIPYEGMAVLAAEAKLGKTWLALQIARAVASGDAVLGRRVMEAGKVLYLSYEDGLARLRERIISQGWGDEVERVYIEDGSKWDLLRPEARAELASLVREYGIGLVIVDTLKAALRGGRIEENRAEFVDTLYHLRDAIREAGASLLIIHHHRKGRVGDVAQDIRGTSAISGATDMMLGLYRGEGGIVLDIRGRDLPTGDQRLPVRFNQELCSWELAEAEALNGSQRAILNALRAGPLRVMDIMQATGLSRSVVYEALGRLEGLGKVVATEVRTAGRPARVYALPSTNAPAQVTALSHHTGHTIQATEGERIGTQSLPLVAQLDDGIAELRQRAEALCERLLDGVDTHGLAGKTIKAYTDCLLGAIDAFGEAAKARALGAGSDDVLHRAEGLVHQLLEASERIARIRPLTRIETAPGQEWYKAALQVRDALYEVGLDQLVRQYSDWLSGYDPYKARLGIAWLAKELWGLRDKCQWQFEAVWPKFRTYLGEALGEGWPDLLGIPDEPLPSADELPF